jgi:thiol-disulfide isomerase/thioredoxin
MSQVSRRPTRLSPSPQTCLVALTLALLAVGVTWWLLTPSPVPPSASAGEGDVRVLSGGIHTVRHSLRPLPTAADPRPDGLPTLVQFGATWCEVCHAMEPVVERVRNDLAGRLVVVEKDVETEMSLARSFRVRGTPTFVVLDAQGREPGRPVLDLDATRFVANLERLLARTNG